MTDAKPAREWSSKSIADHYSIRPEPIGPFVEKSAYEAVCAERDDARSVCQAIDEQAAKNSDYSDWKVSKAEGERDAALKMCERLAEALRLYQGYVTDQMAPYPNQVAFRVLAEYEKSDSAPES